MARDRIRAGKDNATCTLTQSTVEGVAARWSVWLRTPSASCGATAMEASFTNPRWRDPCQHRLGKPSSARRPTILPVPLHDSLLRLRCCASRQALKLHRGARLPLFWRFDRRASCKTGAWTCTFSSTPLLAPGFEYWIRPLVGFRVYRSRTIDLFLDHSSCGRGSNKPASHLLRSEREHIPSCRILSDLLSNADALRTSFSWRHNPPPRKRGPCVGPPRQLYLTRPLWLRTYDRPSVHRHPPARSLSHTAPCKSPAPLPTRGTTSPSAKTRPPSSTRSSRSRAARRWNTSSTRRRAWSSWTGCCTRPSSTPTTTASSPRRTAKTATRWTCWCWCR